MTRNAYREGRGWPAYLLGGRLRTSTLGLILAFIAIWWLYESYQPLEGPRPQVPASDIVPPGFVPDPAYTWVPRTYVQSPTPTTTEITPPPSTTPTPGGSEGATPTSAGPPPPSATTSGTAAPAVPPPVTPPPPAPPPPAPPP